MLKIYYILYNTLYGISLHLSNTQISIYLKNSYKKYISITIDKQEVNLFLIKKIISHGYMVLPRY